MNTKNLTKEKTITAIEELKNRIDFNNRLNKDVRSFRKSKNISRDNFNAYRDEPTPEMFEFMRAHIGAEAWMSDALKRAYMGDTGAIIGQIYSIAVNTYILKDLHDCEKHLKMLESIEETCSQEEQGNGFKVIRDADHTRLSIEFDYIPDAEIRACLKSNGFKWSPYMKAWTRQLTGNAERSLKCVLHALAQAQE